MRNTLRDNGTQFQCRFVVIRLLLLFWVRAVRANILSFIDALQFAPLKLICCHSHWQKSVELSVDVDA